jgi:hypothetical protein
MKTIRIMLAAFAVIALGATFAAGCWLGVGPWDHEGEVVLRWTIDGRSNPDACARIGAARVAIRAVDAWGDADAFARPECTDFEEVLSLDSGRYHAELTMVDDDGRPVTPTLRTETFRIAGSRPRLVLEVDFSSGRVSAR